MTLKDWEQRNHWLVPHEPSREEITNLLGVGERDLLDSRVEGLSADACMSHAYSAALQFASAALVAAGYRPVRGGDHHFRTIESLSLTIGWDPKSVARLNAFRKKRNVSSYERAGDVTEGEARGAQELATLLHERVVAWLAEKHPDLI
jgi:hypothetical protein